MQNYKNNPNFPDEVGMYLEQNGFIQGIPSTHNIGFFKDDLAVVINGDTAEFLTLHDEEFGQRSQEFCVTARYTGIGNIKGQFEWMLLLHVTGFVRLQDFISAAKKELEIVPFDIINLFGQKAVAANY